MALPSNGRPSAGCVDGPDIANSPDTTDNDTDTPGTPQPRKAGKARAARPCAAKPRACSTKPDPNVRRKQQGERPRAARTPLVPLVVDPAAVSPADGLVREVALLRAAIRRLAEDGDDAKSTSEDVKVLAELRHQVAALGQALKTQKELGGRDGDALAAEIAQVLDELGDGLGVPR